MQARDSRATCRTERAVRSSVACWSWSRLSPAARSPVFAHFAAIRADHCHRRLATLVIGRHVSCVGSKDLRGPYCHWRERLLAAPLRLSYPALM